MANQSDPQDLSFQPKVQGFSYKNGSVNPQSPINPQALNPSFPNQPLNKSQNKKGLNIFITLGLEIFSLLFIFLIFLSVLNYFNIISLNNFSPRLLGWLPHLERTQTEKLENTPTFDKQTKQWNLSGKILSYQDQNIKLLVGQKEVNFIIDKNSKIASTSSIPPQSPASSSAAPESIQVTIILPADFPTTLSKDKTLNVYYQVNNSRNLITEAYLE